MLPSKVFAIHFRGLCWRVLATNLQEQETRTRRDGQILGDIGYYGTTIEQGIGDHSLLISVLPNGPSTCKPFEWEEPRLSEKLRPKAKELPPIHSHIGRAMRIAHRELERRWYDLKSGYDFELDVHLGLCLPRKKWQFHSGYVLRDAYRALSKEDRQDFLNRFEIDEFGMMRLDLEP